MGLSLCRKCEAGEETSACVLCKREVLIELGHYYVAFLFAPEDIILLTLGAFWDCTYWIGQPLIRIWFNLWKPEFYI